eukprot:s309_g9.t1
MLQPCNALQCAGAPFRGSLHLGPFRPQLSAAKEVLCECRRPRCETYSVALEAPLVAPPRYERADSNRVGDPSSLQQTREQLEKILRQEVALLDGRSERVFLGGLSQGCTAALDIYLRVGSSLRLGGFVGSVGFLPRDAMGFDENDERIEALLQDEVQRERPVWLQCAEETPQKQPQSTVVSSGIGAMGRGRTKKTKKKDKAWSNGKRKFKAQDPVYRGLDVRQQMAHHSKKERCRAPKGDKDANDIPPIFGSKFGGGKDILAASAPSAGAAGAARADPADAPAKSKKARRRERAKEAEANIGRPAKVPNFGGAFDISQAALPKVQLHITPRVGVRHIRDATVKVFLMYALAIRAMPVPRGVLDGIYVKIKLVDSWVLVGHFPEDMRMGSFVRSWHIATSLFGNPSEMSIICASKQISPDSLLGSHARLNEQGERFAKIFLVLHLQGGSPKEADMPQPSARPNRWRARRAAGSSSAAGVASQQPQLADLTGFVIHQYRICDAMGSDPALVSTVVPPVDRVIVTFPEEDTIHVLTTEGVLSAAMLLLTVKPDAHPDQWTVITILGEQLDMFAPAQDRRSVHFTRIPSCPNHPEETGPPSRLTMLLHQGHKVAPDEIAYYLVSRADVAQFRYLPCVCITADPGSHQRNSQLRRWIEDIIEHSMAFGRPIASVCLVDGHWTPFVAHVAFDSIHIQTTSDGMSLVHSIERCCHRPHFRPHHTPPLWYRMPVNFLIRACPQIFSDDCGYQSVVWLVNHMCTRTPRPFLTLHDAVGWRETFLLHLICKGTACQVTGAHMQALGGMQPIQDPDLLREVLPPSHAPLGRPSIATKGPGVVPESAETGPTSP